MIGVFDSGLGGLAAVKQIRLINPNISIAFFADYKNAPYGTKSERELRYLVKRDLKILKEYGACKILIACCTASTVYTSLSPDEQSISVPIISPTVRSAAKLSRNGKIGVIATQRTVKSGVFPTLLSEYSIITEQFEAQKLVALIENGASDESLTKSELDTIREILSPIKKSELDTLILGCTHFDWLYRTIAELLPKTTIVSSPREAAIEMMRGFEKEKGRAETVFFGAERGYKNGKIQTMKNKRCSP